jgi:hypothetical protein
MKVKPFLLLFFVAGLIMTAEAVTTSGSPNNPPTVKMYVKPGYSKVLILSLVAYDDRDVKKLELYANEILILQLEHVGPHEFRVHYRNDLSDPLKTITVTTVKSSCNFPHNTYTTNIGDSILAETFYTAPSGYSLTLSEYKVIVPPGNYKLREICYDAMNQKSESALNIQVVKHSPPKIIGVSAPQIGWSTTFNGNSIPVIGGAP